jgi:hypothetical protein
VPTCTACSSRPYAHRLPRNAADPDVQLFEKEAGDSGGTRHFSATQLQAVPLFLSMAMTHTMFAMTLVAAILAALPVPALAAHCGLQPYTGSCGAFAKKSHCWSTTPNGAPWFGREVCMGYTEADCCDADGGAVAGLVIGLLIGLGTSHARLASRARLAEKGVLHAAHCGRGR